MISYEVPDMTCGHCVDSITKAVHAVDQGAQVTADLATRQVRIEPTRSNTAELGNAIRGAGYTAVPVDNVVAAPAVQSASRGGCCCR